MTAAEAAEALKVKIYTIGVGTRGVAPYPQTDVFGQTRYVPMEVNIDEELLGRIAERTGGKYYRAVSTETLRSIYDEIDQLETFRGRGAQSTSDTTKCLAGSPCPG
jgi:Ca-activated chloride channel family protein